MYYLRLITLSIAIVMTVSQASAALYEQDYKGLGSSYLRSVGRLDTDRLDDLSSTQKAKCLNRYGKIISDGVLDIRILIGYFDWTIGTEVLKDGKNYGLSPSLDPGAYQALRRILTGRCPGDAEFCGFNQDSAYRFSKRVNIHGKSVLARLDMYYASVTEFLSENTGIFANEQKERSLATKAQFNSALKNADVVFYFGHSRSGGGPDFDPPVFIKGTNKLNYGGYYKANRPGLKNMIAALSSSSHQPAILGLMSCDSRDHFLSSLRRVAPNTGVITSLNVLEVNGVYTAMIGAGDAVLRGQCQPGFLKSIHRTDFNAKNITMDGVFP